MKQDRTHDMFLLGAGASKEAEIPVSVDMTKALLDKFDAKNKRVYREILDFVNGGLLFSRGIQGRNSLGGVDVEDLFNTVDTLARRDESGLSPFIGSWHPHLNKLESTDITEKEMEVLLNLISTSVVNKIGKNQKNVQKEIPESGDVPINKHFSNLVRQVVSIRSGSILLETKKMMLKELTHIVLINEKDASKVKYLAPLVQYAIKNKSTIATLNYDNSIELSCETEKIKYKTGIEGWFKTGKIRLKKGEFVNILKLHGSIDWKLKEEKFEPGKPIPYQMIERVKINKRSYEPAIMFGGVNKLTAEGPFLDLLREFEKGLNESNRLIVIGYSFRDKHINTYIRNWINYSMDRVLVVVDPQKCKNEITQHLDGNARYKTRFKYHANTAGAWLKNISKYLSQV